MSEADGYYIFNAIELGQYKVIASAGWFDKSAADTAVRNIDLSTQNNIQTDINLDLVSDDAMMVLGPRGMQGSNPFGMRGLILEPLSNRLNI